VPLDEVLIKLHPEGFHQEFEADGLNVGAGGISMRASVLPQVGSTLRCQLDSPAGGEAIEMIGRVVWAHDSGDHAGEFGIRFTHLSADDQLRIEALIQRWGRSTAKAPTVRLQLDGVETAIVAELGPETEQSLTVEQPLPFLAIGNGLTNETTGRRGHLEAVELRIDDDTPRLVLSIGYSEVPADRESGIEDVTRDTMPDEPPVIRSSHPSEGRAHDTPQVVRYDRSAEPANDPLTVRIREYARSAADQLASTVGSARTAVTEGVVPAAGGKLRDFVALIGRFIAALRARLDDKPRRKQVPRSQAARAHLKNTRRSGRRVLVLIGMVAGIVSAGWGIYLWAAAGSAESIAETAEEAPEESAPAPEPDSAATKKATASAEKPAAAPVERAPVVEQRVPLPPKQVRGESFGADSVPGGEVHVLRMSNPVTMMDGIVDEGGFSVTIPGSLSLSRAGPIAAAHPDVEHASILNRGDFSELTVRFVPGRQPSYRVEAKGPAVQITIGR
jgi:hypothetical protein